MGFLNEDFIGNPNKPDLVDETDEFISDDEVDFLDLLPPGDPDLYLGGGLDVDEVDIDDENFEPDNYSDLFSDSDSYYEYNDEESENSETEQAQFSDVDQENAINSTATGNGPVTRSSVAKLNENRINDENASDNSQNINTDENMSET